MKVYVGIDPGLSGAVAVYRPEVDPDLGVPLEIHDMPTFQIATSKKSKAKPRGKKPGRPKAAKPILRRVLNLSALADLLRVRKENIVLALLENPQSRPEDGSVQAFKFGACVMAPQAICATLGIPMQLVAPNVWHRVLALRGGADTDESRKKASELFPTCGRLWPNKGHDGRADAALLAYLAYQAGQAADDARTQSMRDTALLAAE